MKGIHCALQGRLGADVELRRSAGGKDWARLSVGVLDGDDRIWVSVSVFEEKARALAGLTKGVEVYVEGRLSLNTWIGRDGAERSGFSVLVDSIASARTVRPRKRDAARADAAPFDDELRF